MNKKSHSSDFSKGLSALLFTFFALFAAVSLFLLLFFDLKNEKPKEEEEDLKKENLYFQTPLPYEEEVKKASQKYGISEARIYAVILVESSFQSDACSSAGALGLMQMLPSTYEEMCLANGVEYRAEDLKKPSINIDYCTAYLQKMYNILGSWDLAHVAYNAGIGNVRKWLSNPQYSDDGKTLKEIPFPSAKTYLDRIHTAFDAYLQLYNN